MATFKVTLDTPTNGTFFYVITENGDNIKRFMLDRVEFEIHSFADGTTISAYLKRTGEQIFGGIKFGDLGYMSGATPTAFTNEVALMNYVRDYCTQAGDWSRNGLLTRTA